MKKQTIKFSFFAIYIIDIVLMAILVFADQILKKWAVNTLKEKEDILFIPDFLHFHYLENNGAAFGMLKDQKAFFVLITVIFFLLFFYIIVKMPHEKKYYALHVVLSVLTAGAFGNFIDRIRLNHVVDFIYFICIDFPVFNFADICVTVSTIVLFLLILFKYKEKDLDFLSFSNNKYREIK